MSEFFSKDPALKMRVVQTHENWFVCEFMEPGMTSWFPYFCGTKEYLGLEGQELEWAIQNGQKAKK